MTIDPDTMAWLVVLAILLFGWLVLTFVIIWVLAGHDRSIRDLQDRSNRIGKVQDEEAARLDQYARQRADLEFRVADLETLAAAQPATPHRPGRAPIDVTYRGTPIGPDG